MKVVNLSEIKLNKKKNLDKRKQIILDSLEKVIEKVMHSEMDEEVTKVLEKLIEPCNQIYYSLHQLTNKRK